MAEIVYEVIRKVTLVRGADKISLRPGARLKIDADDHDFSEPQLERAIAEGKLQPCSLRRG